MNEEKKMTESNRPPDGDNEERALSVFASERNEDLTALTLCLITTFLVLLFTKWLV